MAIGRCGKCKWRAYRNDGGCRYSPSDLPVIGSNDQRCPLTPPRFEEDKSKEQHGKLIVPPETTSVYPRHGEIRSHPPEPTGYSDIVHLDSAGNHVTYRHKDGKIYHIETGEYLCEKDDLLPPPATREQMDEGIKRVRASLLKAHNLQTIDKENEDG